MIKELYLVRHGETDWNRELRIQGTTDTELSETGRQQIRNVATQLAFESPTIVWSSPQARARESASILATHAGLELHVDDELCEIDCGEWEGKTITEIAESDPDGYDAWLTDPSRPAPGGESFDDVKVRVSRVLERLRQLSPEHERVVLVAHAAPIRTLTALLLEVPLLTSIRFALDPASVSILVHWPERDCYRLKRWNLVKM